MKRHRIWMLLLVFSNIENLPKTGFITSFRSQPAFQCTMPLRKERWLQNTCNVFQWCHVQPCKQTLHSLQVLRKPEKTLRVAHGFKATPWRSSTEKLVNRWMANRKAQRIVYWIHSPQNHFNHPTPVLTIRFDGRVPYGSFQSPQDLLDQWIPIRGIKDLFRGSERNTWVRIHGSKRFEDVMRKNEEKWGKMVSNTAPPKNVIVVECVEGSAIQPFSSTCGCYKLLMSPPRSDHVTWPVAKVPTGHVLKDHWNPTSLNSWRSWIG